MNAQITTIDVPTTEQPRAEEKKPVGFRGWLLLPLFSVTLAPLALAATSTYIWIAMADKWAPMWQQSAPRVVVSAGELVVNLALMFFAFVVASHFWRKTKRAPKLYTVFMLTSLAALATDYIAGTALHLDPDNGKLLIKQGVACLIWIPYMRVSERVKNTFVH